MTQDKIKNDLQKRAIKRAAAIAIPTSLVLYSAYKLPKLPDHKRYETLKVVGVFFGGALLGLSYLNWGGGNQTTFQKARLYSAIFLISSSLPYLASRSLFSAKFSTSLKIAGSIGLAITGYFIYKQEIKPMLSAIKSKNAKQILGEQNIQPIQSSK